VKQSLPNFFVERGRKRCRAPGFQILDIFILSGNIRAQTRNLFKIAPNLACFSPPKFFEGSPPNFWISVCKLNMLPTMWQNFRPSAKGPRRSRDEKKEKENCRKT